MIVNKLKEGIDFCKELVPGFKGEYIDTLNLLLVLITFGIKGDIKEAFFQILDLIKMVFLFVVFMVPFLGTVLVAGILKKVDWLRPSSFQEK